MDNAEEILQTLEEFSKLKPKDIPKELDEYLGYVAKTGDPVFQWHLVKYLFHEKLLNVITEFYETSLTIDLPPCPNVDPFNYERMKTSLLERLDTFPSAPFTIQRICELLTNPRKQYNRVDKFMRAIEKNILVVSTREPGAGKRLENDQTEAVLNGIPDNKITEENDDRVVNVCSDNLQYNNLTDSLQVPVENSVNACIIQEQIEIDNSASSTVAAEETKSWCEDSNENDNNDTQNTIKTDTCENVELNVVSTSSVTNSELPKPNILFSENDSEVKQGKIDNLVETPVENVSNEPIVSSTPDSPDSPEPVNSDETCEPNDDEANLSPVKTTISEIECNIDSENSDGQHENVTVTDIAEVQQKSPIHESLNEVTESTTNSDSIETSPVVSEETLNTNSHEECLEDASEKEQVSPESSQQPDSSNDSFPSGVENSSVAAGDCDNSTESDSSIQIEHVEQSDNSISNSAEITETNNTTELIDVSSSRATVTIEEVKEESIIEEENSNQELVVKEVIVEEEEVEEEAEISPKLRDTNEESVEVSVENIIVANADETVASSDDCVSIEEISEIKEEDNTNTETGIVESSSEILEEICDQERKEGSIIHVTSSAVEAKQIDNPVEDICVDQSSCGAEVEEEEAMDVDETSNQPMAMSEGETEGEPMDQSENLQS